MTNSAEAIAIVGRAWWSCTKCRCMSVWQDSDLSNTVKTVNVKKSVKHATGILKTFCTHVFAEAAAV